MSILYSLENYLYIIVLLLFSKTILKCTLRKNALLITPVLFMIIYFTYFIINNYFPYKALLMLVSLMIPLSVSRIIIENVKTMHLIYLFFIFYFFNAILSSCVLFFLPKSLKIEMLVEVISHIIMLISSIIICYTGLAKKVNLIINWTSRKVKILLFFTMFLCTAIICWVCLACKSPDTLYNSKFIYFGFLTLVWIIIVLSISFPILILNSATNTYLKHLTKNYEKQIANQAEHYTTISKANFELRKFRHDFKNISLGVKGLISEGRTEEAVGVLESMQDEIYDATDLMLCFDTGNGIVDALLADKQRRAAAKNILIQFEGSVPPNSIVATDLCVIFGNTIDNAIEACEKIETNDTKTINVKCECGNGFMFLKITNPVNKQVTVLNNTVETTKSNKQLHGFGIYSLNQTVKKHAGNLEITCKNRKFTVDISMCLA